MTLLLEFKQVIRMYKNKTINQISTCEKIKY